MRFAPKYQEIFFQTAMKEQNEKSQVELSIGQNEISVSMLHHTIQWNT